MNNRIYVIEVEGARVFGAHASDHDGCDLLFAFITNEDASSYVEDLLRHWPGELKVPSFTTKTPDELRKTALENNVYPYPSPVVELAYTVDNNFIPTIVEKKDLAHSVKR